MSIRRATLVFALCLPLCAQAQQEAPAQDLQDPPEEVLIIGKRYLLQLRLQMVEAEKNAYAIFNQFNDEKRFKISCSIHEPTGTRFKKQICQPDFERAATTAHGQAFLENYRAYLDPDTDDHTSVLSPPQEVVIASQQKEYKKKLRQVAEQNPEFLQALIQYSEIREQYEEAIRTVGE